MRNRYAACNELTPKYYIDTGLTPESTADIIGEFSSFDKAVRELIRTSEGVECGWLRCWVWDKLTNVHFDIPSEWFFKEKSNGKKEERNQSS